MKNRNSEPLFEVKKGLDTLIQTGTNVSITVNNDVIITLKNRNCLHGILSYVGPASLIVRTSDYEYTESGVEYKQTLILTKDIDDMYSCGDGSETIDWKLYLEAMSQND